MLKQKVVKYLEISGVPQSTFSKKVGCSTHHFYEWLRGNREISDDLADRIQDYLDKQATAYSNL